MKSKYTFPHEVVEDPSLGIQQKRAILSEWASDACSIEACPTLRQYPGTPFPVTLSAVMDARLQLDRSLAYVSETDDDELPAPEVIDFARRRRFENRA
jgi:hypothetical protein